MGGGGPSQITQNTTQGMLPQVVPYANQLMQGASNLATQPYPFADQAVAPMNQAQQAGIGLTQQRALQGSPINAAAGQNLTDTLNGNYLSPTTNPAWQPMADQLTQQYQTGTAAQTDAAAARANALGSSGYNEQQKYNGEALANALGNLSGTLYNQGRQNQLQAAALAPNQAGQDYADLQALTGTGDAQQQYQQSILNAGFANQNAQAQYPYNMLNVLGGGIAGAYGNTGQYNVTGPNPYQANPIAQAMGLGSLGLGGYQAASQLGLLNGLGGVGAGSLGAVSGLGAGAAGLMAPAGLTTGAMTAADITALLSPGLLAAVPPAAMVAAAPFGI